MNIMNKLTLRNMMQNKKRTIVTIIGVIISVAMITAVATLMSSFIEYGKYMTIYSDGKWHVEFREVSASDIENIEDTSIVESIAIRMPIGFSQIQNPTKENKPYMYIYEYNKEAFDAYVVRISEGRYPSNTNEIIVDERAISRGGFNYKIGDTITLDIGKRYIYVDGEIFLDDCDNSNRYKLGDDAAIERLEIEKTNTYEIVGTFNYANRVCDSNFAPGYNAIAGLDINALSADQKVETKLWLNKLNQSIYDKMITLGNEINGRATYNSTLLAYSGVMGNKVVYTALLSFVMIIISIIMIGAISLIYNSFGISVAERSRQLGMLASVGATKRQKKMSVYFEGFLVAIVGIPVGILAGIAGIGITLKCIGPYISNAIASADMEQIKISVPIWAVIMAVVISILTIFISINIPAVRASKITPIEAIRLSQDIKLTGKKLKTSKLTRKIFGIEAEIGLKNLKRNKKRYRATIFSLTISIVLFLSVFSITHYIKNISDIVSTNTNYDIFISGYMDDSVTEEIINSENVKKYNVVKNFDYQRIYIDDKVFTQYYKDSFGISEELFAYFIVLDDKSLIEYCKAIGVNAEAMLKEDSKDAILINAVEGYDNDNRITNGKPLDVSDNTSITIDFIFNESTAKDGEIVVNEPYEFNILKSTDEFFMGDINIGDCQLINFVISESTYKNIHDKIYKDENSNKRTNYKEIFLEAIDADALNSEIEKIADNNDSGIYVYSAVIEREKEKSMIIVISVFTYGFIILITAVCIANTFNTISTSISLRRREFAMIKSIGMTPRGFNKMIYYESIFYGIKALLFGLPLGILASYLMFKSLIYGLELKFYIPVQALLIVFAGVFIIVGTTMRYSLSKVKKENIIDVLREE